MFKLLKLKRPIASNVSADLRDIVNMKTALHHLGYYRRPPDGNFGDWVDEELFNGVRRFQQDNRLVVDSVANPGGETERAINRRLASLKPNRTNLAALEDPAMCSCSAGDDNPWPA